MILKYICQAYVLILDINFFFDGVSVDSHVMPGTDVDSAREVERFGAKGAEVKTDSNGILRAVFNIPAESFFVGDRELEVVDVSQYASIDSALHFMVL